MNTKRCACGRDLNAGRVAGNGGNTRCLICQTAQVMATFVDPVAAKSKKRVRKERQTP